MTVGILLVVLGVLLGCVVSAMVIPGMVRRSQAKRQVQLGPSRLEVLRGVYDQAPYALAVVDRFHDVILYNNRASQLGVVEGRLLVDPVWDAAEATFSDGSPSAFNLPAKMVPGRRRIPSVSGRSEILAGHDERFVVVFADDDSEHRRMEAARRDFVANVSHELKTPVGAMAVLAEALLESKDDPDSVEYFGGRVVAEAHRLGSMVTELIALSRLQGAEKIRDPEPVSIDDVISEAVRRSTSIAEAAEITITTDSPSGMEVLGDRTLLVTAVSNLISNAVNYSPEHTPVSITRSSDGELVHIRVTDRGIGIAPEHQARVFERFFRVDKARSRATGGTGLGLAIVKHVVQNHNGVVKLWSKPGTGSTFTLELPLHPTPTENSGLVRTGTGEATSEQFAQREDHAS